MRTQQIRREPVRVSERSRTHLPFDGYEVPRSRGLGSGFVVAMMVVMFILAGFALKSPYLIEKPGPVINTLGEITLDGEDISVITIDGERPTSDGELNLLTVSIVGNPSQRLSWVELVPALIDPKQEIVHMREVYPEGQSAEDREEANQFLMEDSQSTAIAAALNELGEPVNATVSVVQTVEGSPAEGSVVEGDVITHVNGEEVTGVAMVRDRVAGSPRDEAVSLTIRQGSTVNEVMITPDWNEAENRGVIGVIMSVDYQFDREIDIEVDRIGGPSAGMVFSLALIEELTEEGILDGAVVSGTGTVDDAGNIGPIGGLPQKLWAAAGAGSHAFIMPVANCRDLTSNRPDDMVIVPVETLGEAVDAISENFAGSRTPGIERCQTSIAQLTPVG